MENIQMKNKIQYAELNFKLNEPNTSKPAIQSENDIHYADLKFDSKTQNQSNLQPATELHNPDETSNTDIVEEIAPIEGTETTQNASNNEKNGTNIWLKRNMRKVSFVAMTCVAVIAALLCVGGISIQHRSHGNESVTNGTTTSVIEVYDKNDLQDKIMFSGLPMNTTESHVTGTDLITMVHTVKYENITEKNHLQNTIMYSDLLQASFYFKKKLKIFCKAMLLVRDKIWCAHAWKHNLYIYSRDSKVGDKLQIPSKKVYLEAMAYAHTGHIVLACDKEPLQGLHQLLESGKYAGKITKGRFSAICSFNRKLYAGDVKNKKMILIFEHEGISWKRIGKIELQVKTKISSLFSNDNHMYVWSAKTVYVYDKIMSRVGNIKTPQIQNDAIIVCGVDRKGSIMVIAISTRCVFISDKKGKWHKLNIEIDELHSSSGNGYLGYAALDGFNGHMWVSTRYGTYIFDIILKF